MAEITTILTTPENPTGLMDEKLFEKIEGSIDNDNEYTTWVEYYTKDKERKLVHRSAAVRLKPAAMKQVQGTLTS